MDEGASKGRLPSLDGFRAVAIFTVFLQHAASSSGGRELGLDGLARHWPSGHTGVEVFFVISGFIITYLLAKEESAKGEISLLDFYLRRAFRIIPALWCLLLALLVFARSYPFEVPPAAWLTSITFTRNFIPGRWSTGHLWSIAVEEQFYLVWPFLFARFGRLGRFRVCAAMVAGAPLARFLLLATGHRGFASNSPFTNADFLMAGAAAGMLCRDVEFLRRRILTHAILGRGFALAGVVGALILESRTPSIWVHALFPTLRALLFAYLIASYVFVERGLGYRFLNVRPMMFVGVTSYSLYLWQQSFLAPAGFYGERPPVLLVMPYSAACAVSVALLSYYLVEQPALRIGVRARAAFRGLLEARAARALQSSSCARS